MYDNKINWLILALAVAAIMTGIYFLDCLLGTETLSFIGFGGNFLLGSILGYIAWLLVE